MIHRPPMQTSHERAAELLADDEHRDAPSVSPIINSDVARVFIRARGWRIQQGETRRRGRRVAYERYHGPYGQLCWHLDEALELAVLADAIDTGLVS